VAVYESEQEQIEAIVKWWKENGTSVIAGFLIGLGLLVAWRWWQNYTIQQAQLASITYDQVLYALDKAEPEKARQAVQVLLSKHSSSPYAALAVLNLARQDLAQGDIEASQARLEWVLEQNRNIPELTHIARLRKAKLFLAQHQIAKAKKLLVNVDTQKYFAAAYAELKGDIAVAEQQTETARQAYTQALASEDLAPKHREWLQMKLDDLGSSKTDRITSQTPLSALATPSTAQADTKLTVPAETVATPNTTQVNELTIPIAPLPVSPPQSSSSSSETALTEGVATESSQTQ
jgi:predicted negative regulator of RcsB-dependent stress response